MRVGPAYFEGVADEIGACAPVLTGSVMELQSRSPLLKARSPTPKPLVTHIA
ncbi:hypothetical protein BAUCODRAFT_39804, partial [Baudoinia panamericana UAMH 10762]